MISRRFYRLVSLSVVVPLGNLGEGVRSQGTVRDNGRRVLEMLLLSLLELF